MKKQILFLVLLYSLMGVFCGCAKQETSANKLAENNKESTADNAHVDKSAMSTTDNGNEEESNASGEGGAVSSNAVSKSQASDYPCMVMLEDKLYVDTGEISKMARCGNMDFTFTSHVKSGEPKNNGETNFDSPIEGQYGTRENRIELYYGDAWHVFAYQEDSFEGVSLYVTKADKRGASLTISNDSEKDIEYGEDYIIEQYNGEQETWEFVATYWDRLSEEEAETKPKFGFHDIAYIVEKGDSKTITVDWTDYYGELAKGKYRIVKKIIDFRQTADYDTYTLMAEFELME